ncbi:hypothetical protein H7849_26050 [Alloacidobacterium dinghuense]|uniref:Uncharacterized protein n=1 Tax=Alloacidobacterium dinghuense TaxID=2763107 RepID=A0A7G8BIM6_9BACT|nr:hypothetical protein [Alloacidobacterium dinghuense]QNI32396.1 hypothetical protein H7849_26050 [Alloacidobacterium dinghuense]
MYADAGLIRVATKDRDAVYQNKFMWLFTFLLGALFSHPCSVASSIHHYVYRALFSLAILFTVYAISMRRSLLVIARCLGAVSSGSGFAAFVSLRGKECAGEG